MAFLPDPIAAFAEQFGLAPKKKAKLTPDLAFGAEAVARAQNIQRELEKAKALQGMGMKGAPEGQMISGHYVAPSITQQLAGLAQIYAGNRQERQAGEDQAQIAAAQQEQEANAMREMFAPKTPGGAMQPPSFDEADAAQFAPGGGAATSMLPVAATPQDVAERAAKFQGTKVASQVQDAMLRKQVGEMFDDPKMLQVEGGVFDPKTGEFKISPQAKEKLKAEMDLKRETLQQRIAEADQRALDNRLNRESRDANAAAALEMRRQLKAMGGALGAGTLVGTGEVDSQGRPVVMNNKSGKLVVAGTDNEAPSGATMPKTEFNKQVTAIQTNRDAESETKALMDQAKLHPKAFSDTVAATNALPEWAGSRAAAAAMTKEEAAFRSGAMSHAAKNMHDLYGAALTAPEAKRAAGFIIQPTDSITVVNNKLAGIAKLQSDVRARMGGDQTGPARVATQRRAPVGAPAAPAAKGGVDLNAKYGL